MSIVFWGVCPHPPLLIPEVGGTSVELVQSSKDAMETLAEAMVKSGAQRLVIMSPHAPMMATAIPVLDVDTIEGSMAMFRCPELTMQFSLDLKLISRLEQACVSSVPQLCRIDQARADKYGVNLHIDHGTFVPLYYLHRAGFTGTLVILGMCSLGGQQHYNFGNILAKVIAEDDIPTAVIASGDLSHRLLEGSHYGFDENGPIFDKAVVEALAGPNSQDMLAVPGEVVERAGQCGYRSIMTILGTMPKQVEGQVLSYEGPFGVGYCVAYYLPAKTVAEPDSDCGEQQTQPATPQVSEANIPDQESSNGPAAGELDERLVIARQAVEAYVLRNEQLAVPAQLSGPLANPAPTFVTLKIAGQLRGCIGTLAATCSSQYEEIVQNAISSCSRDPRFRPVRPDELDKLQYQVYVLGPSEAVSGYEQLDPQKYGVVVHKFGRRGVLLPNLEGVDTVEQQVDIACRKAGFSASDAPDLERFEVTTYSEQLS